MHPVAVIAINTGSSSPMRDHDTSTSYQGTSTSLTNKSKTGAPRTTTTKVSCIICSNSSSAEERPLKETKKVRFKQSVKVRKISSHKYYSTEEIANTWYSQFESKQIRARAVSTVKKMMKGKDVDFHDSDCSRGLEFKTPKKNKIRQARKQDIIWTVLEVQESRMTEGRPVDIEFLAGIYISCGRSCAVEAANTGTTDQIAAWGNLL